LLISFFTGFTFLSCNQKEEKQQNVDAKFAEAFLEKNKLLKQDPEHYYLFVSVDCAKCRYAYIDATLKQLNNKTYTIVASKEVKESFSEMPLFENNANVELVHNGIALAKQRFMRSQISLAKVIDGRVDTVYIVTGENYRDSKVN
jgi:hypothetical protein